MADQAESTLSLPVELSLLYGRLLTASEQFRRQSKRFHVRYRYAELHDRFRCFATECHCWGDEVLHRIERLGSEPNFEVDTVVVTDVIRMAYDEALTKFKAILRSATFAESAAKAAADIPTAGALGEILKHLDCKIEAVEAWRRQIDDLKDNYPLAIV